MINSSCIYNGQVVHKRFKPKEHFFKYKVFSLLLDLSELHLLEKELKIFPYNKSVAIELILALTFSHELPGNSVVLLTESSFFQRKYII